MQIDNMIAHLAAQLPLRYNTGSPGIVSTICFTQLNESGDIGPISDHIADG
jgi:hypothetical protein